MHTCHNDLVLELQDSPNGLSVTLECVDALPVPPNLGGPIVPRRECSG